MSFFSSLKKLPEDPIFGLAALFSEDANRQKVNLGVGSYQDAEGSPYHFISVDRAEQQLVQAKHAHEYLPIEGEAGYLQAIKTLLFGKAHHERALFAHQTVGATGALRLGGELFKRVGGHKVYLSTPTWPNHNALFAHLGLIGGGYPYYDAETRSLALPSFLDSVSKMEEGTMLLLHTSCHNPTGVDPSEEQWRELLELAHKRQLLLFFDCAYLGLGRGLQEDCYPLNYCLERGWEFLVALSGSKNFGLYGERIGALIGVAKDEKNALNISSYLKILTRRTYSTPPLFGALIVKTILESDQLKDIWIKELEKIRERLKQMRVALVKGLGEEYKWIEEQVGFFSLMGLSKEQVIALRKKWGVYLPLNGRLNIAGLTSSTLDYIIEALRWSFEKN